MLQRDSQNQRLYLHNVILEKETSIDSQADLLTTGALENNEHLFLTNILQKALSVKKSRDNSITNASKSSTNQSIIPSTKPNNPIREEVSDYINNRSDMQAIYKTIDKRYRIAGKTRLNEKSIESFANKILSQTHSKYSKELLTERLTALFCYKSSHF